MPRAGRILLSAAIVLHMLLGAVRPARATEVWNVVVECSSRDAVAIYLRDRLHSRVVATGTSEDGHELVEIWAADDGEFRIVTTAAATQRACIIGRGRGWTAGLAPGGQPS